MEGGFDRVQRSLQKTEVQVVKSGEAGGRRRIRSCGGESLARSARLRRASRYGAVAWCYDAIAGCYSLGRIQRAKACQVSQLEPGERVLFAGVGRGAEAVLAAQRGVSVKEIVLLLAMEKGWITAADAM